MPSTRNVARSGAVLAATTLAFSGLAGLPLATALENAGPTAAVQAEANQQLENGTMNWSIRDSFLRYIQMPFVQGSLEATGGISYNSATSQFDFGTGAGDLNGTKGTISYPGSISFKGHHGQLDILFSNIRLVTDGDKATIVLDAKSKGYNGSPDIDETNLEFATFTLSATNANGVFEGKATDGQLTEGGAAAFAGFYTEGNRGLSDLTFRADVLTPAPEPTPTPDPTLTADPAPGVTNAAGTVTWGIKDSFLNYLLSQPDAVRPGENTSLEDNNFVFAQAEAIKTDRGYSVSVPGSIQLFAHGGVLNIQLHSLSVETDGDKGSIIATGTSANTGEVTDQPIATFDASTLTVGEDGLLELDGVTTYATAYASNIFGARYAEGTEFDPLYLKVALKQAEPTPAPTQEPTAEPTVAPSESASPTTSPSVTADPTSSPVSSETATPQLTGSAYSVSSATLNWGVKASFINYIHGPIARGKVYLNGQETDASVFDLSQLTVEKSGFDTESKDGVFYFADTLRFTGHNGVLDTTFSNIQLQTMDGKGYLVTDVNSKLEGGQTYTQLASRIAVVDLASLTVEGKIVTLKDAAVTLTESGSRAFANSVNPDGSYNSFYQAGLALSPLSLNASLGDLLTKELEYNHNHGDGDDLDPIKDVVADKDGDQPTPGQTAAPNTNKDAVAGGSITNKKAQQSTDPANANPVCVPVTVTETQRGASTQQASGTVSAATFNWGVRSSFRNYIGGGIARGSWELSGITYENSTFNWSNGSGTYSNGNGSISFTGSVRFTGHGGILDTTFSNPRLAISNNTGTLYLTSVSNDMEGKTTNYGEVAFATVDLSGLSVSDQTISVTGAAATLTEAGAASFAGFYKAGEALDPISFTGKLDTKTVEGQATTVERTRYVAQNGANCDELNAKASKGNLAHTGSSNAALFAGAGALLLVAGAAGVAVARRKA